ncbi:MAG: hypothetical protein QM664_07485, partial [Flavihumibacter sp.]
MARLIFLLLLVGQISFGQTLTPGNTHLSTDEMYGDSSTSSPNIAFNDRIKLVQIDKSPSSVDIRLYKHRSLSNTKKSLRTVFV